ncbi:MAG TPA: DNA gyrase inhibitor YacG [Hyphomicrobiales bacterium]|nr:DNA gyrase inhibitor YacG [Rhodobiaceae bacterium]HXK54430.1 DNA gyrase inhibitor YacG [Hyphomicrobiales bacterium]
MASKSPPGRASAHACPVCAKPRASGAKYHPFCSKRCADVDLNRWLSGAYAIPAAGEDDGEDAGENDYPGGFEG